MEFKYRRNCKKNKKYKVYKVPEKLVNSVI